MKNLFSRFTVLSYLMWIAAVMWIIGMILYIVNSNLSYFHNLSADVLIMMIISLVLLVMIPVVSVKYGEPKWMILPFYACVALMASAMMTAFSSRALSFSVVWLSDIEAGNKAANFAVNHFAVTAVVMLISVILTIAAGFGKLCKEK